MSSGEIRKNKITTIIISNSSSEKKSGYARAQFAIIFVLCFMSTVLGVNTIAAISVPEQAIPIFTVSIVKGQQDNEWQNEDDFYNTYSVEQGSKLNLPIPTRFNSTFAGWYRNAAYKDGTEFNLRTDVVQQNIRLYARFIKNSYTITLIDPRLYLNLDGTVNKDYKPQTFTAEIGTEFTFPEQPQIPEGTKIPYGIPKENFGEFKGWSNTMLYKQASGETSIIAQPNETFENCFQQNVTYWAAYDNWKISHSIDSDYEVEIHPLVDTPTVEKAIKNPSIPFVTLHYDNNYEPVPQPANLPFILPNMHLTMLNNGLKTYSFTGWILSPDYISGQRIYRDGEAIIPENLLNDGAQEISGKKILNVYAIWQSK